MVSSGKRTRGPNKQAPWARRPEDGFSVLRLALDTTDPVQRARVESMFWGAYAVRRALQRQGGDRARAYWAARHKRAADPAATRERLGLSREALEHAAYRHLDAAPHLRRFVTKALAMHLADSVWTPIERHLFADARGTRRGMPGVGHWYDVTRLPGRARSHTTPSKWETCRLHGTLAGHRAAYTDHAGDFVQPRRLRPVHDTAWWRYTGPLAVVFTGLADGTLVLPVRLPTAPSNQPILDHHSGAPSSATVDYVAAARALPAIRSAVSISFQGWQDTLSESTDLSAREGSFLAWRTSTPNTASRNVVVARRSAGMAPYPTLDEIGLGQTTPERGWMRTGVFSRYKISSYLRDRS